jgi:hypothetical protein
LIEDTDMALQIAVQSRSLLNSILVEIVLIWRRSDWHWLRRAR